jgi:AcrR family transcriptional regulator
MTRQVDSQARRELILAAAGKAFNAHGFSRTTMGEIAAAAGIAKGSIYNYFKSKEDLFTQLFVSAISPDESETERMFGVAATARQKLEWFLESWVARFASYMAIGRLVLEFWAAAASEEAFSELHRSLCGGYARWRQRVSRIIADGISGGEFRKEIDPDMAASLITGVLDGLTVQAIMGIGAAVDERFLAALKGGLTSALVSAGGGGAETGESVT